MVFKRLFSIQMPWVRESDVDVGTVTLIHEYMNLGETIPTVIDRLENELDVIRSVEEQMPDSSFISRDYGIILEGMRRPYPEMNTDFDVHDREFSNTYSYW